MTSYRLAAFAAYFAFGLSVTVQAEPLDEIVVTGDLRERTLADVPASVVIIDTATIEDAAVTHFEELSTLVPNLNWSGGTNRARYFQLRGIGERSQYEGAPNPSVGVIIDDIDFSGIGGIASTWDLAGVEVLLGPQPTRYGANALAGLIVMRSAAPTETFDARARVSVGGDGLRSVALALGGPISETLGYRLSAQQFESNGFRDNGFSGLDDTNGRDEDFARLRLAWQPTDATRIDVTTLLVDQDNGYDAFALDNGFTTFSDRPGRDAQRSVAFSARASHERDALWTLTSVTGVASSDIDFGFDADWGNQSYWFDFFAPPADAPFAPDYDFTSRRLRERDTVNQEFRLQSGEGSRLFSDTTDWLLGIYALRLDENLLSTDEGVFTDGTFAPSASESLLTSDYRATNAAAFAQLDTQFANGRALSVGLRAERRSTDYQDDSPLNTSTSESALGGHISLTQPIGGNASAYLSASRGYKLGGFNLGAVPDGRREFAAEYLWNLEAGMRWQHANGSTRLTVFYAERRDQQVDTSFQLVPNDPSTFVFFQDNAASGQNLGLEFVGQYALGERWTLSTTFGLLDATFDDFVTPDTDLSGREQAHAPGYTFAVGLEWQHPEGWFSRLDVNGKDAFYFSNSHDQRSQAYELLNGKLGYRGDRWQLSVWGRNLLDEQYAVRGFFFGNEPPAFEDTLYLRLGDPRQFGVSIDWQY